MIIECPNCNKKFNLDGKLIPENGRTLKCGNCDHIWRYKITLNKNSDVQKISEDKNSEIDINTSKKDNEIKEKFNDEDISDITKKVKSEIKVDDSETEKDNERVNYEKGVKLKMIFIYFIIFVISLLGLIFLLDTFKYNLSNVFPGIIPLFDSLYETLLDLKLFIKDLVN
ncbi:zinc-ribbon domain-containing protein [Candidatus Pelagibacter sp.]|nr:zinc-ribbon domain-containing protein [Candidatus Pelagibacter sp.]